MTTRTTETRVTRLVGLLGGFAALTVGGVLVAPAVAGPQGPIVALDKAHEAADRASARAHDIDRDAGAAVGSVARTPAVTAGQPRAARTDAVDGGNPVGAAADGDGAGQRLASLQPEATRTARYDPARHRDPFRPPTVGGSATAGFSRTPLERYDIGQLKLVGVVWEDQVASAMVEDSAGKGYIVTAGTPIGSSGGVVRSVEPHRILIEESITNFYGNKEPREVVMKLPEEDRSP